jgi:hypothetical protein
MVRVVAGPLPHQREVHLFCEGKEKVEAFLDVCEAAGDLFPEAFEAYPTVYVQRDVPFGTMRQRLHAQTPVKQALVTLDVPEGTIVKVYASHLEW